MILFAGCKLLAGPSLGRSNLVIVCSCTRRQARHEDQAHDRLMALLAMRQVLVRHQL